MIEYVKDESSPGWVLKPLLDDLSSKMSVKNSAQNETSNVLYNLIPSFFKAYEYFKHKAENNEEIKKFKIVFRTFGHDHIQVYNEFYDYIQHGEAIWDQSKTLESKPTIKFNNYRACRISI